MVVYKHSLVFFGLPSVSHDELHFGKFIHSLNHGFPFNSCLSSNVVVAVPAVVKFCAVGFAEKQIDYHLTWNKTSEDMPVHEKEFAVK